MSPHAMNEDKISDVKYNRQTDLYSFNFRNVEFNISGGTTISQDFIKSLLEKSNIMVDDATAQKIYNELYNQLKDESKRQTVVGQVKIGGVEIKVPKPKTSETPKKIKPKVYAPSKEHVAKIEADLEQGKLPESLTGFGKGKHLKFNESAVADFQIVYNWMITKGYIEGEKLALDGILGKNTSKAINAVQKTMNDFASREASFGEVIRRSNKDGTLKVDSSFGQNTSLALNEFIKIKNSRDADLAKVD